MLFDHWSAYDGIVSQGIVSDQKEVTAKPTITRTYARVPNRDHATFLKRLQEAITVHLAFYRDPDDDKCLALPSQARQMISSRKISISCHWRRTKAK